MTASKMPIVSRRTVTAMVASVDNLATEAGVEMLRHGGSAADAAIAANAVLAVTLPNQCGLGGDLFAIVSRAGEKPVVLNASGRSGSGADPDALRAEGYSAMPARRDVRTSTVPGCVDGWIALHERYGRLSLAELVAPAVQYARFGFPASPYLTRALNGLEDVDVAEEFGADAPISVGSRLRRPHLARVLECVARDGRESFYAGEFGESLLAMGQGYYTADDLKAGQANWVEPLFMRLWNYDVWSSPPNSQGYLTLSAAWLAQEVGLPKDPNDPVWAHLLIESMRQAAYDRPSVLSEHVDGMELLSESRLRPRLAAISRERSADLRDSYGPGGTTYLCAVDGDRTSISFIQSNAMSFGSRLLVGNTGIFLQNRGIGFSLAKGNAAELAPRSRPPHTLSPLLVTNAAHEAKFVLGTRGGDSQPQILLQLLARVLVGGEDPAEALAAGRWLLRGAADETSFNTWGFRGSVRVALEGQAPVKWARGLSALGHRVEAEEAYSHPFGHAQVIALEQSGLIGAADPRALAESVGGF